MKIGNHVTSVLTMVLSILLKRADEELGATTESGSSSSSLLSTTFTSDHATYIDVQALVSHVDKIKKDDLMDWRLVELRGWLVELRRLSGIALTRQSRKGLRALCGAISSVKESEADPRARSLLEGLGDEPKMLVLISQIESNGFGTSICTLYRAFITPLTAASLGLWHPTNSKVLMGRVLHPRARFTNHSFLHHSSLGWSIVNSFFNHSCAPNCFTKQDGLNLTISTKSDIEEGRSKPQRSLWQDWPSLHHSLQEMSWRYLTSTKRNRDQQDNTNCSKTTTLPVRYSCFRL